MQLILRRGRRLALLLCSFALPASLLVAGPAATAPTNGLPRFPATNGSSVVFSAAGQLYTVPVAGGIARRLTDGPGYAIFPRFSADGQQLAFTAQYDGNTEVYVMPATGGAPQRLTVSATLSRDDLADRMGPNNIVMAWRNTTPEIAFRSRWQSFNPFVGQLLTVGLDGDVPTQLPLPRGGFMTFSPDDTKIAFNRVFREFRTWKSYRGGMADDVWIYDLKTGAIENITNNPAQDIFPMWAKNGRIYFVSERAGRANLFSYDLKSKATKQLTTFATFDVKFPSIGPDAIVFEQAGQIWRFDLASEKAAPLAITIAEDNASARPTFVSAGSSARDIELSPDGKRVTLTARGDIFTVPAQKGPTRNLTRSTGVHDRDPAWSPDGKWIAYLSDASGEFELHLRAQDGSGADTQLTTGAASYAFSPIWSPDSKKLLWSDRGQTLRYVDVESHEVTEVVHNPLSTVFGYRWSPDSAWIAWTRSGPSMPSQIMLYSVAEAQSYPATDAWYDASAPAFSDDGKWLLFASARDFNPIYSSTEWNHAYSDMERIYLLALAKDTVSPFAPESDEVTIAKSDDKEPKTDKPEGDDKADKPKTEKKPVVVKIDLDGLPNRIVDLPVPASNYSSLRLIGTNVYYHRRPDGAVSGGGGGEGFGATSGREPVIARYDLKEHKETVLGSFGGFEITADGKKMLVRKDHSYFIVDLPKDKIETKPDTKLDFSDVDVLVDRRAEWAQIFDESWRQMRDFFYDPGMHGIDWPGQRAKYGALLPEITSRNDLTYLIGEMIGELHIGHAYVSGGDRVNAPRIPTGLLGARVSRDPASRAYRIDHILPGTNWQDGTRAPLTAMGVNVSEGDYILAVDGRPVAEMKNIYTALIGTVGKQVVLRVNATPTDEGAHDITVLPIADEGPLYYEEWVQHNIDYVSAQTDGRVGYLHIPDMGPAGLNEFVRRYYPQLTKQALIIDVRGNGGGNVSPMIIERLQREIAMVNLRRNGQPSTNPAQVLVGPKVTLLNEYSASDGDLFPYRFRQRNLGKLIGKRSWGGVVGISGSLPFTDGGDLRKPEFASYAADGSTWIIEGHGVDPDIVVDNDPWKEFHGEDQQLDRGITEILAELATHPQSLPPAPPYPNKS